MLDAVLLKMLPVAEPEQLVELLTQRGGSRFNAFSYQALQYFRQHTHVLSGLIASSKSRFYTTIENGPPERLNGQYITGDYFRVLGVGAILGRPITIEDNRFGTGNAVAVMSYGFWQRRFGGDPQAVGKTLFIVLFRRAVIEEEAALQLDRDDWERMRHWPGGKLI